MAKYTEDGLIADVEILEDNSDSEWERYTLKIKKIIRSSWFCKDPEIEYVFSPCRRIRAKGYYNGMWNLTKIGKEQDND